MSKPKPKSCFEHVKTLDDIFRDSVFYRRQIHAAYSTLWLIPLTVRNGFLLLGASTLLT